MKIIENIEVIVHYEDDGENKNAREVCLDFESATEAIGSLERYCKQNKIVYQEEVEEYLENQKYKHGEEPEEEE